MKKILVFAIALLFVLASCSKGGSTQSSTPAASTPAATPAASTPATTPSTGTADSEFDPNSSVDFDMYTSEDVRIHIIGTPDKSRYSGPFYVTSFGQSTDASMLSTVMGRVGVDFTYNATATADDIKGAKTLIVAVGASTKGLGAAGISEADETVRAEKIMAQAKAEGMEIICVHIGGSSRRGKLSDDFADMVMKECSYIILKEDANFDGKFTAYAEKNNIPISLIYATKDTVSVFEALLK